jgi:hemoglobin
MKKLADKPRLISEQEISSLVDLFYARVREDAELGPVFNAAVHNWDAHIALIKDFWSTVLLSTGRYRGNPMLAHFPLPIEPHFFGRWLELFRFTASETMPEAQAAMIVRRAEQIAANMQRVLTQQQPTQPEP